MNGKVNPKGCKTTDSKGRYVIVDVSESEKKKYYLSNHYEQAVINLFGCCYIWGSRKEARLFQTKKEAQATIKDMHRHNTGVHAFIEEIK